jgi:hypothetical protein
MKPLSIIFTILIISLSGASLAQNNQSDYLVVESNYPNRSAFENSVRGSENIYFNKTEIPVLFKLDSLLEGENINNLHLYLYAKAGEIYFGKLIITVDNVANYSDQLKNLKQFISGRVIVHNNLVFNEESGKLLKQRLQEISGLQFETR